MIGKVHFWAVFIFFLSLLVQAAPASSSKSRRFPTKWQYIVVHHSATSKGNAASMDRHHRNKRHMKNGLAYHFVVDNGTSGTKDGQIETGNRWRMQFPGGHCRQDWYNQHGIGVCLVGNFNRTKPTDKQFWSLVWLVKDLRKKYGIPIENIKGHGYVNGEKTECPGQRFPWQRFMKYIK